MLLTAFLINGDAVGVDLPTWEVEDLNGMPPFKAETTVSVGYEDISSIINWDAFGSETTLSCRLVREEIKFLAGVIGGMPSENFAVTEFALFPLDEKKILSRQFLVNKPLRDSVHTLDEQLANATELAACIITAQQQVSLTDIVNNFINGDVTDIDTLINNIVITGGTLDEKVKINIDDNTSGFLVDKLTGQPNKITLSVVDTDGYKAININKGTDLFDKTVDDAGDVTYNNTTSGLTATNVQSAIDEIDATVDSLLAEVVTLDAQIANATDMQNVSSATYIDVPNMTLTTVNSGGMNYQINFSCNLNMGVANKQCGIRLVIDGVVKVERVYDSRSPVQTIELSIPWVEIGLGTGKTIKIQYRSDATGGVITTISNRTLTIFGVK